MFECFDTFAVQLNKINEFKQRYVCVENVDNISMSQDEKDQQKIKDIIDQRRLESTKNKKEGATQQFSVSYGKTHKIFEMTYFALLKNLKNVTSPERQIFLNKELHAYLNQLSFDKLLETAQLSDFYAIQATYTAV